eukprot:2642127-Alexandrium_andersonii.AAC.2
MGWAKGGAVGILVCQAPQLRSNFGSLDLQPLPKPSRRQPNAHTHTPTTANAFLFCRAAAMPRQRCLALARPSTTR